MKRTALTTATVALLVLAAVLPVSAQTEPEEETVQPPAWLAESTVCPWENVNDNPGLARVCLREAGVNTGLAEYAFAELPWDYDPDVPTPSGTPEEAGLVSRWAMGEALHRMVETAVEETGRTLDAPQARYLAEFTDVGWLSTSTQEKLAHLFEWGITTGTDRKGYYSPTRTVTRAQMARFFVRALAAIDRFTGGEGTPGFRADATWQTLGRDTDAFEIPAPFADVQAGKPPAGILDRGLLGAVSILYDLGVTQGTGFNQEGELLYQPERDVSGDQMAMFLVRLLAHTNIRPEVSDEAPDLTAIELPEIQTDGSQRQLGTRGRGGRNLNISPEEGAAGGRRHNEPLPSAPPTRPPREIDFFRKSASSSNVWEYSRNIGLTAPISLQIGDWYWNFPAHHTEHERIRYVLMEFRTAVGYRDILPYTAAFFCMIPEGSPGPEAAPEATRYEWKLDLGLPAGPGLFRFIAGRIPSEGFYAEAGLCDLGDYNVPVPAGGYTEKYPCAGNGWPREEDVFWEGRLLPCQP